MGNENLEKVTQPSRMSTKRVANKKHTLNQQFFQGAQGQFTHALNICSGL